MLALPETEQVGNLQVCKRRHNSPCKRSPEHAKVPGSRLWQRLWLAWEVEQNACNLWVEPSLHLYRHADQEQKSIRSRYGCCSDPLPSVDMGLQPAEKAIDQAGMLRDMLGVYMRTGSGQQILRR